MDRAWCQRGTAICDLLGTLMGRNERIQIKSVPKLFDVVELLTDHASLAAGTLGTVVEELPGGSFLVEFCDQDGKSLGVETLSAAEIARHS